MVLNHAPRLHSIKPTARNPRQVIIIETARAETIIGVGEDCFLGYPNLGGLKTSCEPAKYSVFFYSLLLTYCYALIMGE